MPKLTKTTVDAEQAGADQRFVWDTEVKGFGLKIFPTGAKTFVFQYRTPEGRTRRYTIGKLSDTLTADQARKRAKDYAHEVHAGRDPMGEKKARRVAPTLNQVFDNYLLSDAFKDKAESTRAVDTGRIRHHLRVLLGSVFADKLSTDEVKKAAKAIAKGATVATIRTKARGLARVGGGAGTAKKAITLLRAICKWSTHEGTPAGTAVDWTSITLARDGKRETIVEDADAYGRLFSTLQKMEDGKRIRAAAADAIRFIALTGARRGEATGLRWQWVDLKAGMITLPATAHKAGHRTGRVRIIALPAEAQAIIARQPEGEPQDYVFRPAKGAGPLSIGTVWPTVRAEANLPANLGLHGLRHSIGTHLAMAGASAVELMETLGHRQITTTLRYVHFAERARSTLAERAASVVMAGLKGQTAKASVTPIKKRK